MLKSESSTWLLSLEQKAKIFHQTTTSGGRVCWHRFGDGPPLVLLHGGHGQWTHWVRNIQEMAQQFTVWVPDLPGYGQSDMPPQASLESLAEMLLQTLDSLVTRDTPLRLVGFSFGALVGAQLAVLRGNISKFALLGPAGHGGERRPRGELRSWRNLEQGSDAWKDAMRHNLLMHMLYADASVDEMALKIHTQACIQTKFHSKTLSRAGGLQKFLQLYKCPLLLIWGEHDVTAYPASAASDLCSNRVDCKFHILPSSGHWVQYECAKTVNDLLSSWLV